MQRFAIGLLLVTACDPEPLEEDFVDDEGWRISDATQVSESESGAVMVWVDDAFCSGVLLTPSWVVTARSCLPDNDPTGVAVEMGSQTVSVAEIIRNPVSGDVRDYAVLRLATPMTISRPTMNFFARSWQNLCGSFLSGSFNQFGLNGCVSGTGQQVRCRGYGDDDAGFAGVLREATLPVDEFDNQATITLARNLAGALPMDGDAGSTCTIPNLEGEHQMIGVHSIVNPTRPNWFGTNGTADYVGGGLEGRKWIAHARIGHELIMEHSGKCLDVFDVSTADGAIVQQFPCNNGMNQRWRILPARTSAPMTFLVAAAHSGKCLAVGANDMLEQRPCDASNSKQRWTLTRTGGASNQFELKSAFNNECIDTPGANIGNVQLQTFPCQHTPHQRFAIRVRMPEGHFEVSLPNGPMVWDVPSSQTAGVYVQQYSPNGGANQSFWFKEQTPGNHQIRPKFALGLPFSYCLNLSNPNNADGAKLEITQCGAAVNFYLDLIPNASGITYRIGRGSKCIEGAMSPVPQTLQQYTCAAFNHNDQQSWTLRQ